MESQLFTVLICLEDFPPDQRCLYIGFSSWFRVVIFGFENSVNLLEFWVLFYSLVYAPRVRELELSCI